jgi:hypothetical protein
MSILHRGIDKPILSRGVVILVGVGCIWRHAAPLRVVGRIVDRLVLGPLLGRLMASRNAALAREAVGDKPPAAKSVQAATSESGLYRTCGP